MKKIFLPVILLFCAVSISLTQNKSYNLNDARKSSHGEILISATDSSPIFENAKRIRELNINPVVQNAESIKVNDTILLDLFSDKKYKAVIEKIEVDVNNTLSIRAKLVDFNFSYCIISTSNGESLISIDVSENNELFMSVFDHKKNKYYLKEIDKSKQKKYIDGPSLIPPKNQQPLNNQEEDILQDSPNLKSASSESTPDVITLLIVYTPAAATWANDHGGMDNIISSLMTKAQLVLDNSNTLLTLRLVHSEQVVYTEQNSDDDLHKLRDKTDGYMDNVHQIRDSYYADLVLLFECIPESDIGGKSFLLDSNSGRPDYAFSIVDIECALWIDVPIHEIGHNLGCGHHKLQEVEPGPGLYSYSAGWRWRGNDDKTYCTVMTYRDGFYFGESQISGDKIAIVVPYFSNPDITYQGKVIGDAVDGDNARTIRQTKSVVAKYRRPSEYYVSEKFGDDLNLGNSPSKAWKTLARVNAEMEYFKPGDKILFERGGEYFGTMVIKCSGNESNPIVFGAYGGGQKPVFKGASTIWPKLAGVELHGTWENVSGNIWNYKDDLKYFDVANLVFNYGASFGKKIMSSDMNSLKEQGDFLYDYNGRRMLIYSVGDPTVFYQCIQTVLSINAIEFHPRYDGDLIGHQYIVFENLDFRYFGKCVVEQKGNYCTYKDLDISYIGGADLKESNPDVVAPYRQRYGHGIQLWNGVHDVNITGCRIDNAYEGGVAIAGNNHNYINIKNNVITNCEYSLEFWNTNSSSNTHDINIEHNTCVNAGSGWSHSQRPNPGGTHFIFGEMKGIYSDISIQSNIFYHSTDRLFWILYPEDVRDKPGFTIDLNCFFSSTEKEPVGTFENTDDKKTLLDWQNATHKDLNSIYCDPLFVSTTDFHLQNGSTCIGKGIDGYIGAFLPYNFYIGDITLSTQAEVNAFKSPGVTGNLTISGTNIRDLTPLSNLIYVGGSLYFNGNNELTNLNGLQNLSFVGGSYFIDYNERGGRISRYVSVRIIYNYSLSHFCGLYRLLNGRELPGAYDVHDNAVNPTLQQILIACSSTVKPVATIVPPKPTTCDTWDVPVTVAGFTVVGAISLKLDYNDDELTYSGVDINEAISGASVNGLTAGKFTLDYSGNPVTLNDDDILFTLHFKVVPNINGTPFNLTWSTVPGDCELGGPGGDPIYTTIDDFNSLSVDVITDVPGQWLGITSDWNTASNWCGGVPTSSTNVTIPSGVTQPVIGVFVSASCNNLTIADGATLTIDSDATGTGSLIVSGSVSGAGYAFVKRYMTTGAWHMVASPVSGQSIHNFLLANDNIAVDGTTVDGQEQADATIRGMMDYNPALNKWNTYFTNSAGGNLEPAKGFSMRTDANSAVTFKGWLQAGYVSVRGLIPAKWNCIGNPYTSAIGINRNSSSVRDFLNENAINSQNLDPSYGAIYVWDNRDENNGVWGKYTIISNNPGYGSDAAFDVPQGQAFMVKMNTTSTWVGFTPAMQTHLLSLALKSTEEAWPMIKLQASVNNQVSSTFIAFNNRMTKGLDVTYDAGLLRGGSDLVLYSKLVEDNGIPFAIQALPDYDFSKMIIPLGIESKTGGELVFSSEIINLPSDCQVILEDKLNKTFTDLSKKIYQTTIAANSVIPDRFQIHTSNLTTGLNAVNYIDQLTAYAVRNIEIRVKGQVSKQAVATLYDSQGRVILVKKLEEGSLNAIRIPNIKTAIYLLFVNDNEKSKSFKIRVKE